MVDGLDAVDGFLGLKSRRIFASEGAGQFRVGFGSSQERDGLLTVTTGGNYFFGVLRLLLGELKVQIGLRNFLRANFFSAANGGGGSFELLGRGSGCTTEAGKGE